MEKFHGQIWSFSTHSFTKRHTLFFILSSQIVCVENKILILLTGIPEPGIINLGIAVRMTPLHLAMLIGTFDVVRLLFDHGANPYDREVNGTYSIIATVAHSGPIQ